MSTRRFKRKSNKCYEVSCYLPVVGHWYGASVVGPKTELIYMIYCPTIIAQLHKLYTDSSQQTCALYKAACQLTEVFNVWAARYDSLM